MIEARIIFGKVAHSRRQPRRNSFRYGIYYLALPLDDLEGQNIKASPIAINRAGLLSFHARDHGPMDGSPLTPWARDILAKNHIDKADGPITLVTMPRVFGYVFNPVSFWLCHDNHHALRAVICEVHNTFGETHSYLCHKPDQSVITPQDTLFAAKQFHVSPLLKRRGDYSFQFTVTEKEFAARINYRDNNDEPTLTTSLIGTTRPLTKQTVTRAFWRYPLITIKAITLIHWQALKLLIKGVPYQMKPEPLADRISITGQNPRKTASNNAETGKN